MTVWAKRGSGISGVATSNCPARETPCSCATRRSPATPPKAHTANARVATYLKNNFEIQLFIKKSADDRTPVKYSRERRGMKKEYLRSCLPIDSKARAREAQVPPKG